MMPTSPRNGPRKWRGWLVRSRRKRALPRCGAARIEGRWPCKRPLPSSSYGCSLQKLWGEIMLKIDIATKIVAPDTAIWVVFPGRARRLLNIFLGNDAIFLETPGIKLTPQNHKQRRRCSATHTNVGSNRGILARDRSGKSSVA